MTHQSGSVLFVLVGEYLEMLLGVVGVLFVPILPLVPPLLQAVSQFLGLVFKHSLYKIMQINIFTTRKMVRLYLYTDRNEPLNEVSH